MITIRAARAADREVLLQVVESDSTFKAEEVAVAVELIDAGLASSSDYLLRVITSDDDRALGYTCFGRTPMTDSTWDLYWIVVHQHARGRGLAGSLLADVEAYVAAQGGGNVRVETSETDGYNAARSLYLRAGYPEAGRLPGFYSASDALITYYKRIAPS